MNAEVPRFLNLPSKSDPFALLGLTPSQCTPARVDEALRQRIARTYSHPDGRSEEAETVRELLREAASKLKDPTVRERLARNYRAPRIRPVLTAFDREALAILVGSGGWNAISRARLISLAQHHGVSPGGLMKVISGLSRYAREGHGHLETADITAGQQRLTINGGSNSLARIGAISDSMIEKYAPELREESTWATIKLSMFFGLLAVVLAIFFVRMMLPHAQPAPHEASTDQGLVPAEIRSGERGRDQAGPDRTPAPRRISFEQLPTFAVALPEAIEHHSAASADLIDELDRIGRQVSITAQPSEAVYRRWAAAVDDIALGWILLDDDALDQIHAAIEDVLYLAADTPAVTERFIEHLRPARPDAAASHDAPLTIIRGSWQVRQLARIIQRSELPPILADQARTAFSAGGGDVLDVSIDRDPPSVCTAGWLNALTPSLIERLAPDDDTLLRWELWLAAHERMRPETDFERSMIAAIRRVLASTISLQPDEPGLDVLGRLVSELELDQSELARHELPALMTDDRFTVSRLATFTALLAAHPDASWMSESLLMPLEADEVMRRRVRHNIERAWPELDTTGERRRARLIEFDPEAAARWHTLHEAILREAISPQQVERMRQLTAAALLNQAAALLSSGDVEMARRGRRVMDGLEQRMRESEGFRGGSAAQPAPTNTNPRARGSASGSTGVWGASSMDGRWAAAYESAGRNQPERIKLLANLRDMGGDLGPVDAMMFVREVYRGTPMDVREKAQIILTGGFGQGVNIAMLMLDLLSEAPRTEQTGDLITRYTGAALPSVQSERWRRAARLALLDHAAKLRGSGEPQVNAMASAISDAALSEGGAVDRSRRHVKDSHTPTDAAHKRYIAWHALARGQLPGSIPVPGDMTTLNRRHQNRLHFAESPIQAHVALTISVLELASYVTSIERPELRDALDELLRHAAEQRAEADDLLRQAVLAERAISEVWRLRLGRDDDDDVKAARTSIDRNQSRSNSAGTTERAFSPNRDSAAWFSARMTGVLKTHAGMKRGEPRGVESWYERLEALDPRDPQAYFELAEEVADMAESDREQALARHLFALSGHLAPERLARSACLALAQLEPHRPTAARLHAMANLLDPYARLSAEGDPADIGNETREMPGTLDLGEALSAIRLGRGNRALTLLRRHSVEALFEQFDHVHAIDRDRLLEDARISRRPRDFGSSRIDELLLVEVALLAGADRPWTADLTLYQHRPLIEVDEDILRRMLGNEADRPYFRDGRWVSRPDRSHLPSDDQ